ncbi:MAG: hypothetical protein ACT4OJ_05095 [Bacteroidota bacterium]
MENEKSLFDISIDMTGKIHLKEAAKWARFFAIFGFISLSLMIAYTFFIASQPAETADPVVRQEESPNEYVYAMIVSVFLVILCFFPCLFTLRFANKMKTAIDANDMQHLNESFRNLKITLRYLGIVTIILLVLIFIGLLSEI